MYTTQDYLKKTYRDDIQGIRAIGALMIIAYHVWIGKVSGGVDVFFVISGFLMGSIFLRNIAQGKTINPFRFWGKIIKRIAPSAYLVLLVTLLAGYFIIPEPLWLQMVNEGIYSSLQLENIKLMQNSVDYLAREEPPSPVQQFWALSTQMQFYFFLPLIFLLVTIFSKIDNFLPRLFLFFAAIWLLSFSFSLYQTYYTPQYAYFNPATRAWEFTSGILLAFAIPFIKINWQQRILLGCIGLTFLLLGGVLIPKTINFPGYIALVPVISAIFLIISGVGEQQTFIQKILSNRFFLSIGNSSFTIYLWHWPIFVFYLEISGNTSVAFIPGVMIALVSIALAFASSRLLETPFRERLHYKIYTPYLIGSAFMLPVLVVAFSWRFYILNMQQDSQNWSAAISASQTEVNTILPSTSAINIPKKEFLTAKSNLPEAYHQKCHQNNPSINLVKCEFGDTQSSKTILLVGNSHSTQWLPALDQISKNKNFKLISITKSECPWGLLKGASKECKVWHKKLVEFIETSKPYAIITTSTRAGKKHPEYVPETYIQQWKNVSQLGVKIVAIRDNPWFDFDPPLCVARNKNETLICSKSKHDALQETNPSEDYINGINNLLLVDMTRFLCDTELCFASTSNQLIYRDSHHLSVPYVQSLTNKLSEELGTFL